MNPDRKAFLTKIASLGGRLARRRMGRPGTRPRLVEAGGSLLVVIDPEHCLIVADFFRTGGDLRWDRARKSLVWTTGTGDQAREERTIGLPSAPDLSAIGTGAPRKSKLRGWAIGIACLLILPPLWVRLLSPPPPGRLASPSGYVPGALLSPGPVRRIEGTGWMK